ncbi:MAG TPA: N-acetyltransferase [Pseudomonadota bacterium]|nr:N-acetyltransferase [Pseudomonadota bacterium]
MIHSIPNDVSIRIAVPADVDCLSVFGQELVLGPLLSRYGLVQDKFCAELCGLAQHTPAHETLLVATGIHAPDRILGIARVVHTGMFGSLGGYLKLIAVGEHTQGLGIGSQLLKQAEITVAKNSRDLFLLVSDFNHAAQRFYLRHGYTEAGKLPGYVRTDITEILFWKHVRNRQATESKA